MAESKTTMSRDLAQVLMNLYDEEDGGLPCKIEGDVDWESLNGNEEGTGQDLVLTLRNEFGYEVRLEVKGANRGPELSEVLIFERGI